MVFTPSGELVGPFIAAVSPITGPPSAVILLPVFLSVMVSYGATFPFFVECAFTFPFSSMVTSIKVEVPYSYLLSREFALPGVPSFVIGLLILTA